MKNKKIKPAGKLSAVMGALRKKHKKVVFTNGCFDILHPGHVRYLQDARRLGDVLVVALNTDASVRRLKGKDRPINSQEQRAQVLAALECVDYVTFFGQDTPLGIVKLLRPAVLVKGADWHVKKIIGGDFVKTYGGKVKTIRFLKGYSTTGLINRIKALK